MQHIINHPKVEVLIAKTDEFIEKIGYTEHGRRHAKLVSTISHHILKKLNFYFFHFLSLFDIEYLIFCQNTFRVIPTPTSTPNIA